MNDSTIDRLYQEGSQSLRHYSLAILNVRNVAIGQGFAVIAGEVYLANDPKSHLLLVWTIVFGSALTAILYALQWNYKQYFDAILPSVVRNEQKLCHEGEGPWAAYALFKGNNRKWRLFRLSSLHGVFVLLLLAQGILFVTSLNWK